VSERSERTSNTRERNHNTAERSERTDNTGERSERTESTGDGGVGYLSLQWIAELSREVAESEHLARLAATHAIGVTQVVTDGPEGTVTYHFEVRDGAAHFGAGPADPEDVRMEQDWDTAVAVATGELNAQEAFIGGRIRLTGNQQLLLESQPVFGALDAVFSIVRERTIYS
jgi:putative sterol carrier protein